jgi:hypothetical protein
MSYSINEKKTIKDLKLHDSGVLEDVLIQQNNLKKYDELADENKKTWNCDR